MKKIFYNGNIITMEEGLSPEALFMEEGKIKKIGLKEEILNLRDEDTEIIDLCGNTLMPSFIDPHSHLTALASTLSLVPLKDVKSFDEIVGRLKAFKEHGKVEKGKWIVGFGFDNNSLVEKDFPDRKVLDRVSTENPVLIAHVSGHMGCANSLGLRELNITSESKNLEGGLIGREEDKKTPNGYLEEGAFIHNASNIMTPSKESIKESLKKAEGIYLSNGITTIQDGLTDNNAWMQLKLMADEAEFNADIVGYVDLKNCKNIVSENSEHIKKYKNRLKIGGYKIFLDGSPQGKTAWLTKPYEGEETYRGYAIYKDEEVKSFVETSLEENMQLLTHCNGDAAADQLLNAFYELKEEKSIEVSTKPVMVHAQTVRYDQVKKMKDINMIPSYFVAHTYYWGDIHIKNLGMERAERISPVNTTLKEDVLYTFHQDTPVIAPNMFETVWCAVNRITKEGVLLGENERISVFDALKGVTINAAYQYSEEDLKGSIKEGKLADLIIVDKNPLEIDKLDIKNIKIIETLKEGKTVYKA